MISGSKGNGEIATEREGEREIETSRGEEKVTAIWDDSTSMSGYC